MNYHDKDSTFVLMGVFIALELFLTIIWLTCRWYFPIQNLLLNNCPSFFISWTKSFGALSQTIRILWRWTQLEARFFFYKIKLKMADYPGSGYKMSSYGLKVYNPQETVGQWTQCCKVYYITHARRSKLQWMFCRRFHEATCLCFSAKKRSEKAILSQQEEKA